jgi:glutamyl-tRNA synthetase
VVEDKVQGTVAWDAATLDDLILLRSDGVPTYMMAVVVDDHDMAVTHVIRGDDHLTNAARQTLIYRALDWPVPVFAHLPLIHGPDGAKFSKRHGALGVEAYRDMGYLPAAMRNYLARLGWSHGDDEFFTTEQMIEGFDLGNIGRSAARFDFAKLENLNGQHIRATPDTELVDAIYGLFAVQHKPAPDSRRRKQLVQAMPGLKDRAKTLVELIDNAHYILSDRPFVPDQNAARHLAGEAPRLLARLTERLQHVSPWTAGSIEEIVRAFAGEEHLKLGQIAQPLRVALTGRTVSPGVFDVMETVGRDETFARLGDVATLL